MNIKDFLSAADVAIDVRAADKASLLKELAGRAAAALNLSVEMVVSEIEKRDELGSTGIGRGVAIPHARLREVRKAARAAGPTEEPHRVRCHRWGARGRRVPAPAPGCIPAGAAQLPGRRRAQAEGQGGARQDAQRHHYDRALSGSNRRIAGRGRRPKVFMPTGLGRGTTSDFVDATPFAPCQRRPVLAQVACALHIVVRNAAEGSPAVPRSWDGRPRPRT
jgi:Phosphoenolpyruvate-dependent sugar phosphotransferase system, EIIA 2